MHYAFCQTAVFISACLTVLNLAFSDTSAFQLCKNNNFLDTASFLFDSFPQNYSDVAIPIFVHDVYVTQACVFFNKT